MLTLSLQIRHRAHARRQRQPRPAPGRPHLPPDVRGHRSRQSSLGPPAASQVQLRCVLSPFLRRPRRRTGADARLAAVPIVAALVYACTTPLGIAVGLGIRTTYNPESAVASIVAGTLDATSAGILLWAGLVECLAHDFVFSAASASLSSLSLSIRGVDSVLTFSLSCARSGRSVQRRGIVRRFLPPPRRGLDGAPRPVGIDSLPPPLGIPRPSISCL